MSCRRVFIFLASMVTVWPSIGYAETIAAPKAQSVVADGPVKLSVSTDKTTARVAEPIQLTLTVEAPRGTRVELPSLPSRLGDFDVRSSQQIKDLPLGDSGDVRQWLLKAVLETIKTGDVVVPSLEIHFAAGNAESNLFKTLSSKPITIRIASVLENRADLKKFSDIKGVVDVPVPERPSRAWIAWTAIGGAVVLAGIAIAAVIFRARRAGPSPAEWALEAMTDLEKLPVSSAAEAETVFNEIVDVIREFFELEFGVPTISRTTREFLAEAKEQVALTELARKRLTWLSGLADEIKFARLGIGAEQVHHAFQQARAFIVECEQVAQAAVGEAA